MSDINIDNTNSRHNPSDDYVNLVKMYEEKHDQGEGMFNGRSLLKFVDLIKLYLENNNCKSVLDYGCGKAVLYTDKFSEVTDEIDCPLPEYWVWMNVSYLIPAMKSMVSFLYTGKMLSYVQMFLNTLPKKTWVG